MKTVKKGYQCLCVLVKVEECIRKSQENEKKKLEGKGIKDRLRFY